MVALLRSRLEPLRDALRARGQRPSILLPGGAASAELMDAMAIVEDWGPFVEVMYLVMAVDRRVLNVEREVLRGALAILSDERVRTRHMEAMLDAATRNVGAEGTEARFKKAVAAVRGDPARARSAAVVAAAVAAADDRLSPEENAMLVRLLRELGVGGDDGQALLAELQHLTASKD
jgi:tellurite resistance protein